MNDQNGQVIINEDVPQFVKHNIILQEIQMYKNTRYQLQLRHRVQKAIGGTADQLKAIEDELLNCEKALDLLKSELESLPTRAPGID